MAVAQVRDVAAHAGVSPATVSNALNHPDKVSARTRERIRKAIEELGYVPNDAARQLRAGSNRAVGMVVLDVTNPFFAAVARGAEEELTARRRPMLVGNSNHDPDREDAHLTLFEEQRVAGVLISPLGDTLQHLRRLKERGTAIVFVDRKTGATEFSSVSVDDVMGGRIAAEHLIEQGCRRIGIIGGSSHLSQVKHRLMGVEEALRQYSGVSIEHLSTSELDVRSGKLEMSKLLARPSQQRPDGIFALNDLLALGALQTLAHADVKVPQDIALVGYDDIEFASSATIPISSVRQPAIEMGRQAAKLLCDTMSDPTAPVQHTVFQPDLITRESSTRH